MAVKPREDAGLVILLDGLPYLEADATISETHSRSAKVTSHPRERGSDVADHYQPQLVEFSATIFISNTPLLRQEDNYDWPADAYIRLLELQEEQTLVTVITHIATYENCALISVSAPVSNANALTITTSWRLVDQVSTQEVAVPAEILRGLVRASGKTKDATKDQVGTPSAEAQAADAAGQATQAKSLLKGLFDAAGIRIGGTNA